MRVGKAAPSPGRKEELFFPRTGFWVDGTACADTKRAAKVVSSSRREIRKETGHGARPERRGRESTRKARSPPKGDAASSR